MKNIWKIIVIGVIIGLALMMTGFLTGARIFNVVGFGRNAVTLGEVPLRGMPGIISNVMNWNHGFRHDVDIDFQAAGERQTIALNDNVTNIDISAVSANIEFVHSNDYRVEIINRNNNRAPIRYSVDDNVLIITQDTFISFGVNLQRNDSITVFLPSHIDLDSVDVRTVSGNITLNEVTSYDMRISATSGAVRLDSVTVDNMSISVISGSIRADNLKTERLIADTISGSTTISGELRGDTSIDTTSGTVRVTVLPRGMAVNSHISVLSGNINVNGERISGRTHTFDSRGYTDSNIIISTLSGNVHLDF